MSELTKEKIYKKELIAGGATGNNNLERIRSLAGGGASKKSFFMEELDVKLPEKLSSISACGNGDYIYLCSGVTNEGHAVGDFYKFNTKTNEIVLVKSEGTDIISATLVYAYGFIWVFGGELAGASSRNKRVYVIDVATDFNMYEVTSTDVDLGYYPLVIHEGNVFYIFKNNDYLYRLVVDETGNFTTGELELEEISTLDNYPVEFGGIFKTDEVNQSIFTVGGRGDSDGRISRNIYHWGIKLDTNGKPTLALVNTETLSKIDKYNTYAVSTVLGEQKEKYVLVDSQRKVYYEYSISNGGTIVSDEIPLDSSNSKIKNDFENLASFSTVSTANGIYVMGGTVKYGDNVDTIYKITLN